MCLEIYKNGNYLKHSPTWHIEDSPWKAEQIAKILTKNNIEAQTICEVGCGAGEILNQLYQHYSPQISYYGFEISPQAYELCKQRENDKIKFYLKDILQEPDHFYDVILLIDVIEHMEDLYGFLEKIKSKGRYKIFHIPLELFVLNVISDKYLVSGIRHPGHIQFFTKSVALEILKDKDYKVLDYFYTPAFELPHENLTEKILRYPQKFVYLLKSDVGIRIFGGPSLLVLTE